MATSDKETGVDISMIALNRMVEDKMAEDKAYREGFRKRGRPVVSDGRALSDEALLAKLCSLGFDVDRDRLLQLFPRYASAEQMSEAMIADARPDLKGFDEDWPWIALVCLWERWQPHLPSMELIDDKMQAGYRALEAEDSVKASRIWLETWQDILGFMDRAGLQSLDDFDRQFRGSQAVFNWIQDFEIELHNAGLDDPQFFHQRVALCKTVLDRFSEGDLPMGGFKTGMADAYAMLGDLETADRLYLAWLDEKPRWGWGWIGWADCYWFSRGEAKNPEKAIQILKRGLAVSGVDDRHDILERLADVYEEQGMTQEAQAIRQQINRPRPARKATMTRGPGSLQTKTTYDFGEEGLPLEQFSEFSESSRSAAPARSEPTGPPSKAGRNDPCPCGSGKKYKKCCGKPGRGVK